MRGSCGEFSSSSGFLQQPTLQAACETGLQAIQRRRRARHSGFIEIEGYERLEERYFQAIPSTYTGNGSCGLPRKDAFHIFRDPVTSDLPWPGVLVGMTIPSLWYWCTDQVIVQRSLSAKNLSHAKGGSLLAAFLKVLPLFMMVMPGMISRVLFTDDVACAEPEVCKKICGNPSGCSDIAYPKMVIELLPTGLRGLMMSVMIAALMSSLTSIFNSASTIFTMDLWRHLRPRSAEFELMIVGRVFVLVLVVVSILWIPLVQASQGGQLFIYIQSISSYLQPPVAVVFIAGCFWERTNEKGAFWGLTIGLVVGIIRMVLDFVYAAPQCDQPDTRPGVVKYVHYLYLSMILALLTLIVVVVVSLWTEPPPKERISRLTWLTRWDEGESAPKGPITDAEMPKKQDNEVESVGDADQISTDVIVDDDSSDDPSCAARLKKAILWVCGMEKKGAQEEDTTIVPLESTKVLLYERPLTTHLLNCSLIVCMSGAIFLWGYFG